MPTFLSDPPSSLYIILGVVGVLCLVAAFVLVGKSPPNKDPKKKQSSSRRYLIAAAVVALVAMLGLFICDRLFESDKEQIVRKLNEMSDGVRTRNLDLTFSHLSDKFRVQSTDKPTLRTLGDRAIQSGQVTEIRIWAIEFESFDPEGGKAVVNFRFKVIGEMMRGENQFIGEGTFVREPDGQWRAIKWRAFPFSGKKDEYPLQGL